MHGSYIALITMTLTLTLTLTEHCITTIGLLNGDQDTRCQHALWHADII